MGFDEMLEASFAIPTRVEPGDRVEATVVSVGRENVFLDVGARSEAVLPRDEATENGEATVKPGDRITVWVASIRDGSIRCTRRLGGRASGRDDGLPALSALEEARRSGIPVEGVVKAAIKGGFEVQTMGVRAFCPLSQMDIRRRDDPGSHVGQTYAFLVTKLDDKGRDVVLSRRRLLEREAEERARAVWDSLQPGATLEGVVASIAPYGAFVDIGGVEGLLHVSEISHERVSSPSDVLSVGQRIVVEVREVDRERRRLSLSLKSLAPDPWESVSSVVVPGREYLGRVTRLAPFGAFVEIAPGVEGLVHVSRLADGRRVRRPGEIVSEGQEVTVRVLEVDTGKRRLSLALHDGDAAAEREAAETYAASRRESGLGTLGDLIEAARARKR